MILGYDGRQLQLHRLRCGDVEAHIDVIPAGLSIGTGFGSGLRAGVASDCSALVFEPVDRLERVGHGDFPATGVLLALWKVYEIPEADL